MAIYYNPDTPTYLAKECTEYNDYLKKHINGVVHAWIKYANDFIQIFNLSDATVGLIENLVKNHDKSKYDRCEFNPYRKRFYPNEKENNRSEKDENEYREAILHHYHNNPHHWNYWVYYDINEPENPMILDMPDCYIIELICDWISVSDNTKGATSDPLVYYNKVKDDILLSESTRNKLEYALNTLFGGNNNE